ncbi:MAG: D-alanyl-D-alanine carboxypeptidase [Dehalococcoidia bacterium]|nr:D-alanyl-D-alanine carboxypeptidase [Dehalococcoidia bacterium]
MRGAGCALGLLLASILLVACATASGSEGGPPAPPAVTASVPEPAAPAVVMRLRAPFAPPPIQTTSPPPPSLSAEGAVVLDEGSGAVLYERNAHTPLAPASVTKIMTALIALERGNPEDLVTVQIDSRRMRGSTVMGLVPDEQLTLQDLLYGMMLPSGNDAAAAIAEHIAGTQAAFVELMNRHAEVLGLLNTHFANPHGLDATGHYSSAYDLALLAREAMARPDFQRLVNARYWEAQGTINSYRMFNSNALLTWYSGADGVKIGYTRSARQTIVASATRDGHRVYAVALRSPDRNFDASVLLSWAFNAYSWRAGGEAGAGLDGSAISASTSALTAGAAAP